MNSLFVCPSIASIEHNPRPIQQSVFAIFTGPTGALTLISTESFFAIFFGDVV